MRLFFVFLFGFLFSLIVASGMVYIFAAYESADWLPWGHEPRMSQDRVFEVIRNAVTFAAALGVGITLFFNYRRQQTAENAQAIAVKAQTIAADALTLSASQHDFEISRRKDESVKALRERFSTSAEHLGSDNLALAIAAVHSLESLADEWQAAKFDQERQNCINLLCTFYRLSDHKNDAARQVGPLIYSTLMGRLKEGLPEGNYWPLHVDLSGRVHLFSQDLLVDGAQLILGGLTPSVEYDAHFNDMKILNGSIDFAELDLTQGHLYIERSHFSGGTATITLGEGGSPGTVWFKECYFAGSTLKVPFGPRNDLTFVFEDCLFQGGSIQFGKFCHPKLIRLVRCTVNANIFAISEWESGFAYAEISVDDQTVFAEGVTRLRNRKGTIRPQWTWESDDNYRKNSGVPAFPERHPSGTIGD